METPDPKKRKKSPSWGNRALWATIPLLGGGALYAGRNYLKGIGDSAKETINAVDQYRRTPFEDRLKAEVSYAPDQDVAGIAQQLRGAVRDDTEWHKPFHTSGKLDALGRTGGGVTAGADLLGSLLKSKTLKTIGKTFPVFGGMNFGGTIAGPENDAIGNVLGGGLGVAAMRSKMPGILGTGLFAADMAGRSFFDKIEQATNTQDAKDSLANVYSSIAKNPNAPASRVILTKHLLQNPETREQLKGTIGGK